MVSKGAYGSAYLLGPCSEGIPEFVAQFSGSGSYMIQNNSLTFMQQGSSQPFSISIWVYPTSYNGVIVDEQASSGWHDSWIELVSGSVYIRTWPLTCINIGKLNTNQWSQISMVGSISGTTLTYSGYINGVYGSGSSGTRQTTNANPFYLLGAADTTNCGSGAAFQGLLSNYQFYNTSLSANNIATLYMEGIGGAPIKLQNLAGWWPLNGNINDYSGNGNGGTSSGLSYTASWYNNYVQP